MVEKDIEKGLQAMTMILELVRDMERVEKIENPAETIVEVSVEDLVILIAAGMAGADTILQKDSDVETALEIIETLRKAQLSILEVASV